MIIKKTPIVLVFSFCLGLLEVSTFYILFFVNSPFVSKWNPINYINLVIISSIIWFLLNSLFVNIKLLLSDLNKTLNIIFNIVYFCFIVFLCFAIIASWVSYVTNGFFLTRNSITFAINNLPLLIQHFLQTSESIFFLSLLLSLVLSSLIILTLLLIIRMKEVLKTKYIMFIPVLLSIFILIHDHDFAKASGYNPLISILQKKNSNYNIDKQTMEKYLIIDNNIKKFDNNIKSPVIIIVIESMRNDLISMNPCPIPNIRKIYNNSFVFKKAYATSSFSDYSDLSIWYSRYPLRFDYFKKYRSNDPYRGLSIFEFFNNSGYSTAYISSQNEKWGSMINWLKDFGIDYFYHSEDHRGDTWYNKDDGLGLTKLILNKKVTAGKIEDSETLEIAKNWISSQNLETPFFLGMNLQNTHYNYVIPLNGKEPFQPASIDFPMVYSNWPKSKIENVKNRYLNAFYNLDIAVNDFIEFLKSENIWDKCYFGIIGDSGEAFYEHGYANHSGEMYDEIMNTFTLIKPPFQMEKKEIITPISHIDYFPSLLDLMEIEKPSSFQGISCFQQPKDYSIFFHNNSYQVQDGIVIWPWKLLIRKSPQKEFKLFNLVGDPNEKLNLVNNEKEVFRKLLEKANLVRSLQLEYYSKPEYHIQYPPPNINFNQTGK